MAKLIVGSSSFDMSTWNLADIASGAVTSDSATEVDVTGAGAFFDYTLSGTGFSTFDTNGFPTSGTVTSVTMVHPGRVPLTITGISISAADFMGFVNGNDPAGLEAAIFSGNDTFGGKAGNDTLLGFGGNDIFNMTKGGNDTVSGGDGDDQIKFGAAFTAADSVDGGAGTDRLFLDGDYSAGVVFGATTLTNVEQIILSRGFGYNLTLADATIGAGQTLTINAEALHSTNFAIDGSADTDGTLRAFGGSGFNTMIGGAGIDQFHGAGAGDNFTFTTFNTEDRAEGTGRDDTLVFNGDFSGGVALTHVEISGVNEMLFEGGHDYVVSIDSKLAIAAYDAHALGAGDSFSFDASASTLGGSLNVEGGAGSNTLIGSTAQANFTIQAGGTGDITFGSGGGNVTFNGAWSGLDHIGGGAGELTFANVSGTINIADGQLSNVHNIVLQGGTPDVTLADGNLASGQVLSVFIESTDSSFDGSAETNGVFNFDVVPTNDTDILADLSGGTGNDVFTFSGGQGSSFTFSASDHINGGGGNDTLSIVGGSYAFKASTMVSVETLQIGGNSNFPASVTLADANVPAGQTLNVIVNSFATFNGAHETDGIFNISVQGDDTTVTGGAGDDIIMAREGTGSIFGGAGDDTITGDTEESVTGGAGADHLIDVKTFRYTAVSDSTSTQYDTLTGINFNNAKIYIAGHTVSAVDAAVNTGALSTATFDADLAAAVGAGQLGAGHAVIFTASSGTLAGDHFLVVDANGVAGYQAGADYVMLLDSPTGTLNTHNFG
jgi:Ca2+-binding RTX toxin-like protein